MLDTIDISAEFKESFAGEQLVDAKSAAAQAPTTTAENAAQSPAAAVDYDDVKIFEHIKQKLNIEDTDFASLGNRIKEHSELSKWRQDNESLVPTTDAARQAAKFLNREGATFEDFVKYNSLDIEKLSGIEQISKMYELRDGLPKEQAEALAYTRFSLDSEIDQDSKEALALKATMTLEQKQAQKYIVDYKKSYEVEATPAKNDVTLEEVNALWGADINKAYEATKKIKFNFDGQELGFDVPDATHKAASEKVGNIIANLAKQGIDISATNKELQGAIQNMYANEVRATHQNEIMNAFLNQYKTKTLEAKANVQQPMSQSNNPAKFAGKVTSASTGDEIGSMIIDGKS